ncbi:MAG TPA: GntR family transcriptional regulator [Chloroflexota bacterium]|nr:GntR family transcriptional regulator [Chloroflexota bacterium]
MSVPNSEGQADGLSGRAVVSTTAGAGRLSAQAYDTIREQILRRQLPAGSVLAEDALAVTLGMSKTPVRQALLALHQEGLLELGPRRQMQVCSVPPARRQELREVREALERISVSYACRDLSDDDLDHLRTLLRRQRRAAEAGRVDEFIDLDEELHLTIAARCGLDLVPRMLRQLRGFVRLMQLNTRREEGYLLRVLAEHERIVDAIEARDEDAAYDALREHLHTNEYVQAT